jgi:ATP-dependent Lhr-like helicase
VLGSKGATFFDDLVAATGLLKSEVESALAELVASGIVGSDGFSGLRALVVPASRPRRAIGGRSPRASPYDLESAGRFTLFARPDRKPPDEDALESFARVLLRRWGVVFRRVFDRENGFPPFKELLRVYRRLEARGEIRGGRFVSGFSGEQFALPEAVTRLRQARKRPKTGELVALSAADPLNVFGVLTPGRRVTSLVGNRILFRDGVPVAFREGSVTELLEPAPNDEASAAAYRRALVGRPVSPRVRAYLGNSV